MITSNYQMNPSTMKRVIKTALLFFVFSLFEERRFSREQSFQKQRAPSKIAPFLKSFRNHIEEDGVLQNLCLLGWTPQVLVGWGPRLGEFLALGLTRHVKNVLGMPCSGRIPAFSGSCPESSESGYSGPHFKVWTLLATGLLQ